MFLGINIFWSLVRAHFNPRRTAQAKMSLSRAQNRRQMWIEFVDSLLCSEIIIVLEFIFLGINILSGPFSALILTPRLTAPPKSMLLRLVVTLKQ